MLSHLVNGSYDLTRREAQILFLVGYGKQNREIAAILNISFNSVRTYRKKLMQKFNINNAVEMTHLAQNMGLITPGVPYNEAKPPYPAAIYNI